MRYRGVVTIDQIITVVGVGVPCLASISFIIWLWWPKRGRPKPLADIKQKAAKMPPTSPPLDDMVLAIMRSLQNEPERWNFRAGGYFRDDNVSFSVLLRKNVWIYDDYTQISKIGGENCRIEIAGEHNGEALEEAARLAEVRHNIAKGVPKRVTVRNNLRGKLGV
jgi:hypothetical protein